MRESAIAGQGVFATKNIRVGETIGDFEGEEVDRNTPFSLTLEGKRIEPSGVLRHLNHSCAPNSRFRGRRLVAAREIVADEEVTIDYEETESAVEHGFRCNCGAPACRRTIGQERAEARRSARRHA